MVPSIQTFVKTLLKERRGSQPIYEIFISKINFNETNEQKWLDDLNINNFDEEQWKRINKNIFSGSSDKYLQWFQYRIVHRIIGTNKLLFKIKIKESPKCTFCQNDDESISHLFFDCPIVLRFLISIQNLISNQTNNHQFTIEKEDIILGNHENQALNTILLLVKKYIYDAKMKEHPLNLEHLLKRIKEYINIEKFIQNKNNNLEQFLKKWEGWDFLYTVADGMNI